MAQTFTYDGTQLARVVRSSVRLVAKADHGTTGEGSLEYLDDAGTLETLGLREFAAEQSSCSVARSWTGIVGARSITPLEDNPLSAARKITFTTVDLNERLARIALYGRAAKRPREPIGDRVTWLLGSQFLSGLVSDFGFVTYPDDELDKHDYRTQFPADVLRDCALPVGFNFFAYWSDDDDDCGLFFEDWNVSTDFSSTLKISSVAGDADASTVFAPMFSDPPAKLDRSPDETVSETLIPYRRFFVRRIRAATASTYMRRSGIAPNAQVKTRAKARALGDQFLLERRDEEDVIDCAIQVPKTKVNLVQAGQRIQARFRHLGPEGYAADYSWFRVVERGLEHPDNDDEVYKLPLRLTPQEQPGVATMVQCASTSSAAETTVTLASDVTVGNLLIARLITRNSETIPTMFDGTWTLLGSGAAINMGGANPKGAVAMYAKIATSTSPTIGREATANQMQMTVCEIAGKSIEDITVFSTSHATGASWSPGSGGGTIGLYIVAIPRANDGLGNGYLVTPAGSWTVEKNQDIDNGGYCAFAPPDPWWWAAKIENQTSVDLAISITAGFCGGQTLGQWCAAAMFV